MGSGVCAAIGIVCSSMVSASWRPVSTRDIGRRVGNVYHLYQLSEAPRLTSAAQGWYTATVSIHAPYCMCRGLYDVEPVSRGAGFELRAGASSLQMLCALLLQKRFKRPSARKATAASVSRGVAMQLAPLWLPLVLENATSTPDDDSRDIKWPAPAPSKLSDREIERLPDAQVNANIQLVSTAEEATVCAQHILRAAEAAGKDLSKRIVGFDMEYMPADATSSKGPQRHVPTVIQVWSCSSWGMPK